MPVLLICSMPFVLIALMLEQVSLASELDQTVYMHTAHTDKPTFQPLGKVTMLSMLLSALTTICLYCDNNCTRAPVFMVLSSLKMTGPVM